MLAPFVHQYKGSASQGFTAGLVQFLGISLVCYVWNCCVASSELVADCSLRKVHHDNMNKLVCLLYCLELYLNVSVMYSLSVKVPSFWTASVHE